MAVEKVVTEIGGSTWDPLGSGQGVCGTVDRGGGGGGILSINTMWSVWWRRSCQSKGGKGVVIVKF